MTPGTSVILAEAGCVLLYPPASWDTTIERAYSKALNAIRLRLIATTIITRRHLVMRISRSSLLNKSFVIPAGSLTPGDQSQPQRHWRCDHQPLSPCGLRMIGHHVRA